MVSINFHDKVFLYFLKKNGKKWRKNLSWKFTDELSIKYLWIHKWGRWIRPKCQRRMDGRKFHLFFQYISPPSFQLSFTIGKVIGSSRPWKMGRKFFDQLRCLLRSKKYLTFSPPFEILRCAWPYFALLPFFPN